MRLAEVIGELDPSGTEGDLSVEISRVDYDSRRVEPGSLFCCIPGASFDGHAFAAEAVEKGAAALMVERPVTPGPSVPVVRVRDSRRAMGMAAATLWGHPSRSMDVVGVTGTNGKTSTVALLANVLREAGRSVEVLGTLTGERTTPESPDLQEQLAAWRDRGVDSVAMEVSSHALTLERVSGMHFRAAVFTNLSRDHLDFHHTVEAYFEAKARLFRSELSEVAVVNLDSPHGRLLRDASEIPVTGYSLDDVEELELGLRGSTFRWRGQLVRLPLAGAFNVSNALAAAGAGSVLGIDEAVIARGLSQPLVVPGRFEVIDEGQPFSVVVDFAHTPDGLEQVLGTARGLIGAGGSLVVVFGCGGQRDAGKRPAMGEVAARLADRVVLTADNSRGEQTGAIIDAIREGFDRAVERRAVQLVVEPDRRAAIARSLDVAQPGDLVVVAGKGHERTITLGSEPVPFDDREVAREELRRIGRERGEAWSG
ncbi:UDP-N-acetylmuramoyl-L-alanyl-D-glutamate--2,6-diaminopimelate ligase [Rhabdothermincola sediminis]|uniref:UDP-N-acetylmuramoyl-L-alanyl-D-glutamate--2, 6-diaminopimelate ligase n=1 Tax=Rhabdothermincola sediminis TaxID=2751370 RepID=UPI001AA08F9F|nr:UDP-N-acetylmuramoyl-L-alanyl-D-glutamate--2,6-diaminopimelate ligase [Rhabdothermincola sediminis]